MTASDLGTLHLVRALPGLLGAQRVSGIYGYELGGEDELDELGFWWLIPRMIKRAQAGRQGGGRARRAPGRPFWLRGEELGAGGYIDQAEAYLAQKRADLLAEVDRRVAQVQAGISAAAQGAYGHASGIIADARDGLWSTYYGTIQTGAGAAADAIRTLAQRAGDAWASLGAGAGAAFRSFWGISPAEGLGGIALFAGILALGFGVAAVYVISTGGGQAYLSSLGAGAGRAIGEVGAGYGGAARELGRGGGDMLGALDIGKIIRGIVG